MESLRALAVLPIKRRGSDDFTAGSSRLLYQTGEPRRHRWFRTQIGLPQRFTSYVFIAAKWAKPFPHDRAKRAAYVGNSLVDFAVGAGQ
jgi:hypothetical protein